MRRVFLWVVALGTGVISAVSAAADAPALEIPEPFARFEHMIGSWKGTAVPAANRLKGWPETHRWAWKFARGKPVGMALELDGDKTLSMAQLSYRPEARQYRLEGTDRDGKPVAFAGALDKAGKALVLDRVGANAAEGVDRLTIRPNSNQIRYVLELTHQEPGAPQFAKVIEVGLTKEGESFAAGGSAADLPKCILTGGAATMTVSYRGKSYPICCSGCRDEFNENPEKYASKAAAQGSPAAAAKPAARVGKDDGSFDGLVDEATPKGATKPAPAPAAAKAKPKPADAPREEAKTDAKAARAASQLRLGQNLEKAGKSAAALQYYRQIVKDYPDSPQAKTAAARIKAIGGR